MANKSAAAPRFSEVVFRGKPKVVKALLEGLLMGAGRDAQVFYSYDDGIHHEGKLDLLKEKLGVSGVGCHMVVDGDTADWLKKMARQIASDTGLEITSNRRVRSASLAFSYHAYAQPYSDRIVALLKDLPAGLKLQGYRHEERSDPSAKGVEVYTSAHDFEAEGSGTVNGRIDLLVALRHRMEEEPLIKAEDIVLKFA